MKNFIIIIVIFCVVTSKAQVAPKQAIITMKTEMRIKGSFARVLMDTILVRNSYILDPIKEYYSTDETTLSTLSTKSSTRQISSGSRLQSYCFSNFEEMVGMSFDVEKKPTSKTILPYQFSQDNPKQGKTFVNEPFLSQGLTPADYVKEKDTVINGQNCLLIKRTKVIQNVFRGRKLEKVVRFRLAIDPKLTSYTFPFVSEKIVQHFGGGAIVYMDGMTEGGSKSFTYYSYSEFKPSDQKLFDYYQKLYEANIKLLDKFRKKK